MRLTTDEHAEMVQHAEQMLDHHFGQVGMGDVDDYQNAMVDLLVYFQHYAAAKGIDFTQTIRSAQSEFARDEVTA